MIPSGSTVYTDNVRYQHQFGSDPMVIVFTGDTRKLLSGRNLRELQSLQRRVERSGAYHAVLGPLTTLRFAADQLPVAPGLALGALARDEARATTAAERDALAASFRQRTDADAARLAGVGSHSIDNPTFVDFLIHDATGAVRPSLRGRLPRSPPRVDGGPARGRPHHRPTRQGRRPGRLSRARTRVSTGSVPSRRARRSSSSRSTTGCGATWRSSAAWLRCPWPSCCCSCSASGGGCSRLR